MTINIEQYKNIFGTINPTVDELTDAILCYEGGIEDVDGWLGTICDLWDGREHLTDWQEEDPEFVAELKGMWFWDENEDYKVMLDNLHQCGSYYHKIVDDLTKYREEVYGNVCNCCGQVVAA